MQRKISEIKTMLLKSIKDKETLMETWTDETLEPHVYLIVLLIVVFIMSIAIGIVFS